MPAEEDTPRHRAIIGLPAPVPGVTDEIWAELGKDLSGFIAHSLPDFDADGNTDIRYLVDVSRTASNPDIALGNLLWYYEIYSRSARKASPPVPMMIVTQDAVREYLQENEGDIIGNLVQRITQESQASSELAHFWEVLGGLMDYFREQGWTTDEIGEVIDPVYALQGVMLKQAEINQRLQSESFKKTTTEVDDKEPS